jgi:clan AA aspartic protease
MGTMGEIVKRVHLENAVDRERFEQHELLESQIAHHSMSAIVDTGAVMLMLPQDVVEKLKLRSLRKVVVSYADERKEERAVAGPVVITIDDRSMYTECIVGPPLSEALIGQIVLETMDLVADCQSHTLAPRPESPIYPSLKMK